MERLGVSVSLTSGFHPESNGQVERVNQDVGRFLRSYCQDRPGEWATFIPWAEMAHDFHSFTNLSPFQCVLGYQPVLAPWHQSQIEAPAVDEWFWRSEETWDAAHVHLQRVIRRQKASADRHRSEAPVYAPGDRVWLSTRNLPLRLLCRKLGRWRLVRSRSLMCGRFLRPLWTLRGPRCIMFEPSWTQGVRQGAFSTSWSGRGTVQRKDAGCWWRTPRTLRYCGNFTVSTRIVLRLVLRVVPEAGVGAPGGYCHDFRRSWCLSLFGR
ncbi:uncharacterized protein LOC135553364 [Oncorhynchus masou masou]|uniref:uncharacterized protein LOC135553364 n=1 Tax=Oncorhynchus masou masou TaxID=90313 RepID=UPI0031835182